MLEDVGEPRARIISRDTPGHDIPGGCFPCACLATLGRCGCSQCSPCDACMANVAHGDEGSPFDNNHNEPSGWEVRGAYHYDPSHDNDAFHPIYHDSYGRESLVGFLDGRSLA